MPSPEYRDMASVLTPSIARPSPVELIRIRDAFTQTRTLRHAGLYQRVRPGVYASRPEWDRLAPWERYLARVHAYALVNPGAVFAYESAAALLGLPVFGEPTYIHTYDFGRTKTRRFGDVFVHTSVVALETTTLNGHTMTSRAVTAVDLMRVLPAPFGLAVGDAAISPVQGGTLARADLAAIAEASPNIRGRALVNLLVPMLDSRSESTGESVSRGVILWSGFEPPDLQRVFVSEGFTDRVDFWWESVRAIGESDGYAKYVGATPEETVQRVVAEKRREDRLRRQCHEFGRWDWAASTAITPIVRELERMRIPRVSAPRSLLLSTVRDNPRSRPQRTSVPRDASAPGRR